MSDERAALRNTFATNFAGDGMGPPAERSATPTSKIASALLQYQIDKLGIDYIERRNGIIDAVTLDDAPPPGAELKDYTPLK